MTVPTDLLIPFGKSTAGPRPPPAGTRESRVFTCVAHTVSEEINWWRTDLTGTAVKYREVKQISQGCSFGFRDDS